MKTRLEKAVHDWLHLEGQGADRQADEALQTVFSRLPEGPLPVGFADRVMARAGLMPASSVTPGWSASWVLRFVVSLCLALAATSVWMLPGYMPAALGIFNLASATEVGVGALAGVLHQLGSGLVVWRVFSSAGSILSSTLSSPGYLLALLLAALFSLAAFRVLHEIVVSERSSRYVGSI